MHSNESSWRRLLQAEHHLLRELVLLLLACLALGLYFLEHMDASLEQARRDHLAGVAALMAQSAAEDVALENRVGLNVLVRQVGSLDSLQGVALENLAGQVLAQQGRMQGEPTVQQPVRLVDGSLAGQVRLWAAPVQASRRALEAGFVLLTLCLLGLRLALQLLLRRLRGEPLWPESGPAVEAGEGRAEERPACVLRLALSHRAHLETRYTPGLLEAMLAPYQQLLEQAAARYDGVVDEPLTAGGAVLFRGQVQDAAYRAACTGILFQSACQDLAGMYHLENRVALEFGALLTGDLDDVASVSWCESAESGQLLVPVAELVALGLDACASWDSRQVRCAEGPDGDEPVPLQPLEQLVQRHQNRIEAEAGELLLQGMQPRVTSTPGTAGAPVRPEA